MKRIFDLYTNDCLGEKAIAKRLTREGAPPPKPFNRKDPTKVRPLNSWAPSTIYAILRREDYRGVYWWNRSKKRDEWGERHKQRRPESEWKSTACPRIVSDEVWFRARDRRAETEGRALRFADGRLSGRVPRHGEVNLLAGMATCDPCGGGITVETYQVSKKTGQRKAHYLCNRRRMNGSCANGLRIPVAELNEAVLSAIEEHVLRPGVIEEIVQLSEVAHLEDRQTDVQQELKGVAKRIDRLKAAIEMGGDLVSLVERLRELETKQRRLAGEAATLRPLPRLAPKVVENRLAEWRRMLRASTAQARAVLQRVIPGRITLTPHRDGRGWDFCAPTRFDKLFSGIVVERPKWIPYSTEGTEHIGPEDTFDADYGRLLAKVQKKLLTVCPS